MNPIVELNAIEGQVTLIKHLYTLLYGIYYFQTLLISFILCLSVKCLLASYESNQHRPFCNLLFGSINTCFHIKSDLAALRSYAKVSWLFSLKSKMRHLMKRYLKMLTPTTHFNDEPIASENLCCMKMMMMASLISPSTVGIHISDIKSKTNLQPIQDKCVILCLYLSLHCLLAYELTEDNDTMNRHRMNIKVPVASCFLLGPIQMANPLISLKDQLWTLNTLHHINSLQYHHYGFTQLATCEKRESEREAKLTTHRYSAE